MKWQRVSDYCIASGMYRISKFVLGGQETYQVFFGERLIGRFKSSAEAKAAASHHDEMELANTV